MVMQLVNSLMIALALFQTPQTLQTPHSPGTNLIQGPVSPLLNETLNSLQTREIFRQLVRQYSPTLGDILRLDPALLTNQAFLAPYPRLAEFLKQHPEIAHNPSFYVGDSFGFNRLRTPEERSSDMFEKVLAGIAVFTAGLIMLSVLCWIVKTVIDHRRWLRVSKTQNEVHSKLLDRFSSNQDLLAYIQTPAGRHFLESAPISTHPDPRSISAPVGRIIFSVQAGIVLALAGVGFHMVSQSIGMQELAQPLYVVGMLATSVGIGFVLSAGAAYVLSRRLGLLDRPSLSSTSDNAGVSPPNA
jgi:hypothetical protein